MTQISGFLINRNSDFITIIKVKTQRSQLFNLNIVLKTVAIPFHEFRFLIILTATVVVGFDCNHRCPIIALMPGFHMIVMNNAIPMTGRAANKVEPSAVTIMFVLEQ